MLQWLSYIYLLLKFNAAYFSLYASDLIYNQTSKMIKRLSIILIFSGLIFGSLFAFKFYQQQANSQFKPPPPAVVAVTEVIQVEWQSSLTTIGDLVAVSGVSVSNEIAGIVKAIHFDSGQNVKKGQLLIELDTETDLAEQNGLLAQQRLAQIQYTRSKKLSSRNLVSKSDYDQNLALLDKAIASVKTKQTLIEKKRIRAPFSGSLGIRKVNLGQYLISGASIVTLQQLSPIYIDFQIPERYLSHLKPEQQVNLNVQAYPDRIFKGFISTISPLIEKSNRSVQIRATLPNADHLLRPGMFAKVRVVSGPGKRVLSLPDTAISYNPYGDFVFIIESGAQGLTVQSRLVETGMTKEGRVEIVKGLSLGEQVVSAGQMKLRNGMLITIDKKSAPGERTLEIVK